MKCSQCGWAIVVGINDYYCGQCGAVLCEHCSHSCHECCEHFEDDTYCEEHWAVHEEHVPLKSE